MARSGQGVYMSGGREQNKKYKGRDLGWIGLSSVFNGSQYNYKINPNSPRINY